MPNKLNKLLSILLALAILTVATIFSLSEYFGVPIWQVDRVTGNKDEGVEVYFIDVGQGDAAFIKTPYDQRILIDGGPGHSVISELDKHMSLLDRRVDMIIVTHPHSDHIAGVIDVIERYDVGKVFYSGVVHSSPTYFRFLNAIKDYQVDLEIVDKPQKIVLGPDAYIDLVYPFDSYKNVEVENLNNTSIVARLAYKDSRILFTGDIEEEAEKLLVDIHNEKCDINNDYSTSTVSFCLTAEVLKSPHHGSATSNTEDFIKAVDPREVVISASANNDFGHPHLQIVNRYNRMGVLIKRTDKEGTIKYLLSDKN